MTYTGLVDYPNKLVTFLAILLVFSVFVKFILNIFTNLKATQGTVYTATHDISFM